MILCISDWVLICLEYLKKHNWLHKYFSIIFNAYLEDKTYLSYLPNPPLGKDMTQGQFLSGV